VTIMTTDFELHSGTTIERSAKIAAHEVIEAIRRGDIVVTEYLNQQRAARYCGYSEPFFNKVCRAGRGPRHVMVGRRWRTRRTWLQHWMESGGPHSPRDEGGDDGK
jgi:hypothetical protein